MNPPHGLPRGGFNCSIAFTGYMGYKYQEFLLAGSASQRMWSIYFLIASYQGQAPTYGAECRITKSEAVVYREHDLKKRYLLCPQCGTHRFFFKTSEGENLYFHVGWDHAPLPTEISSADLSGVDFSIVHSTGCMWKGGIDGLVKYLK